MAQLSPEQLARGVICSSAGNHAQGVALGARQLVRVWLLFAAWLEIVGAPVWPSSLCVWGEPQKAAGERVGGQAGQRLLPCLWALLPAYA